MPETGDIRVDQIMPRLNDTWASIPFEDCLLPSAMSYRKLKRKEFHSHGVLPIIDQGEEFIAGYTDAAENKYEGSLPLVIFGDHTRRVKYIDFEFAVGADGVKLLHPFEDLDPKFFYYYLRALRLDSQGYSRHYRFLKEVRVPIPPLNEQRRIVAKLEKLLSRVNGTQQRLATIPFILKRFRQSILSAACSGRLTADWRDIHSADSGEDLLKRILNHHKTPSNGLSKLINSARADNDLWVDLPRTWTVTTVEALLRNDNSLSYGILKPGPYDPTGIPMLRVMDIGEGKLNSTQIFRVKKDIAAEYKRTKLERNDVLLAVMATVGRSMVVPEELIGANVNRALAVLKITPLVNSNFVSLIIRSPQFQDVFAAEKIGSAQLRINLGDLRRFGFPLPPFDEQQEIVRRAETLFKTVDAIETRYLKAQTNVDNLTQSILAKAFRGELVLQDPNDEPASVLLERITTESNGSAVVKRRRSRK